MHGNLLTRDYVDAVDRCGRLMFGKSSRLRLGIWVARLPGRPRTFSTVEYFQYLAETDWRELKPTVVHDMRRFQALGMVRPVEKIEGVAVKRLRYWERVDSPLWDTFLIAGFVLSENLEFEEGERRRVLAELVAIRDSLKADHG